MLDIKMMSQPRVYHLEELRNISDKDEFINGILGLQNNSITKLNFGNIFILYENHCRIHKYTS